MTQEPRPVAKHLKDCPVTGGKVYGNALQWQTLFSQGLTPTNALTAGVLEMSVGSTGNLHWHEPAEIYFILSGEGVVEIAGTAHAVVAESAIYIPGNAPHAVRNTGTVPLRLFYAFAADGMADITYHFPDGSSAVLE